MKNSILFYASLTSWHPNHQPIVLPSGETVFVRTELVKADSVDALDLASAVGGETFLNSMTLCDN